jgi:hypothetical protein
MAWNTQFAILTFFLGLNWFGISELQGVTGSPVNILNYAKMEIQMNFCMYVLCLMWKIFLLVALCNSVAYFCTTHFQRKKEKITERERVNLLLFTGKKAG